MNRYDEPHLRVLVFRDVLLPFSQTFVATQVEYAAHQTVMLLGSTRVPDAVPVAAPSLVVEELFPGDGTVERQWRRIQVARFKLGSIPRPVMSRLRDFGPQVVIAHFASDGLRVSRLARRLGVPLVVVLHGSDVMADHDNARRSHFGARHLASRWHVLGSRAAALICVSNVVRKAAVAKGLPEDKLHVIHLGVPLPQITMDGALEEHRRSNGLLFVGRLVESKGPHHLLRALALLGGGLDWQLRVIGDGPAGADLVALAAELGIHDRIQWLGIQPADAVSTAMRTARVLVVPSLPMESGVAEGLPTVVKEAEALALPVCAYATGGIPEAFNPANPGGWTAQPGDVAGLAEILTTLLSDDELIRRMGRAGRETAVERFDAEVTGQRLFDLLSEVTTRHDDRR